MLSIILINDEKIDVKRTTVFTYKDKYIKELTIEDVSKIDSNLCPSLINHKTNIVFDTLAPTNPYNKVIEELSVNTYYAIFDPYSLLRSPRGASIEASRIISYLCEALKFLEDKRPIFEKKYHKEVIETTKEFLSRYLEACTKYPDAKIKLIN